MLDLLLSTSASYPPLLLRLVLAFVILPHGLQKALGWFGGFGFVRTMDYFRSLGFADWLGVSAILAETLGALLVAGGLLTRPAAAAIAIVMVSAAVRVHLPNGFFMNWFGNQKGEGVEYFLLATGIALALVVAGGGRGSLDAWLVSRR